MPRKAAAKKTPAKSTAKKTPPKTTQAKNTAAKKTPPKQAPVTKKTPAPKTPASATKRKATDPIIDIKVPKLDSAASTSSQDASSLVIPIDAECPKSKLFWHVHSDGKEIYNSMLNQTNISANNNKFYVLQILKSNSDDQFMVWFRWGRVGRTVGTNLEKNKSFDEALKIFKKKFRDKTGNAWERRDKFEKVKGKYDMVEIDYGEKKDAKPALTKTSDKPEPESKLHPKLQDLVQLIFNVKEWEASVKELDFDVKKAPLGNLTKAQVTAGYESLKKISDIVHGSQPRSGLEAACSEFYTRIPHNFGMKRPPLITRPQEIKRKLELLEALNDIQLAMDMLDDTKLNTDINSTDANYKSLNCDLQPIDHSDNQFKMVEKYVANTHASTHQFYQLEVEDVFTVHRDSDAKRFKNDIDPKMLLWHGSRLTNWGGILGQGLRIAPPEAPVTGYMFGKGVYFADMVSKSANYCYASKRQPYGLLLLCDVALGDVNRKYYSDYYANLLPAGKNSTKGIGGTEPDPAEAEKLDDVIVPLGKAKAVERNQGSLLYNEYIVYNVAQIRPRFLVKLKFKYGWSF